MLPIHDDTLDQFQRNLSRIESLFRVYNEVNNDARGRPAMPASDILRASVVFMHAALEDFLRSLAAQYWPTAGDAVLDKIPLAGTAPATKHTLGALSRHTGKTVDDVIAESVRTHLEEISFNSTGDLAAFIASVGLDTAAYAHHFPDLAEMIKRRHHIVHQADRNDARARGQHRARPLGLRTVDQWFRTVGSFARQLSSALSGASGGTQTPPVRQA